MSRMASAPHDPRGGGSEGAGESQHLDASIAFKGIVRDDAVLDSVGGTRSDCDSSKKFEACAEDHGLSVGDTPGGDTSSPCVGHIVCGVVRLERLIRTIEFCFEMTYWHRCCRHPTSQRRCQ